jgi:hypothetical protein
MNESAIPAKNLTRPILVEGATRGTYDTLTQPKTTRTNHIVESASPSSVIRNDTYEDLADSPFPSTNPPKPNSFLRGQIHYDKPVGSSDLGIPNSLFFSLAVRKQRVVVPHQEDGRSEALSTGFSDEFEAVFVGHVVTEGGLRGGCGCRCGCGVIRVYETDFQLEGAGLWMRWEDEGGRDHEFPSQ